MSREPIRIAQIVGKMSGGGVESVVMNYYRNIDRDKVQFDFVVNADSDMVPRDEIVALGGDIVEVAPYRQLRKYRKDLFALFSSGSYEIVHSHVNALSVFPLQLAKRAGVSVRIAHSHSTGGEGEFVRNTLKNCLRPFSRLYPTHRYACSKHAGEWLFGKGYDFEIISNAFEVKKFDFNKEVRDETRRSLGIQPTTFAIGHIGRFMPQKNQAFAIDVFRKVIKLRSNSVLILVGEGEQQASVKEKVEQLGLRDKVKFLGQRYDVDRLYQAFDTFLLPSLYEGLGLVAIEAQRSGLPCILSDKITREADVTGEVEFLPIGDSSVWADAICAKEFGSRISVRPESFSDYDIEVAAAQLSTLYCELAKGVSG